MLIHKVGMAGSGCTTSVLYNGLIEFMRDDVLGEAVGLDKNWFANFFQRTFKPGCLDNYQKTLAWQCYRNTFPVHDKLFQLEVFVAPACLRYGLDDETILHALVQCPELLNLIVYVEHILSHRGRAHLSAEPMIKIVPPSRVSKEGKACFLCTIAVLKE